MLCKASFPSLTQSLFRVEFGTRPRTATAHKLARILWAMIVSGQPYDEAKAFDTTPAATARRIKNLQNQAQALNLKLIPA